MENKGVYFMCVVHLRQFLPSQCFCRYNRISCEIFIFFLFKALVNYWSLFSVEKMLDVRADEAKQWNDTEAWIYFFSLGCSKKYLRLLQLKQIILLHGTVINFFFSLFFLLITQVYPCDDVEKKVLILRAKLERIICNGGKYLSQSIVMRKSCFTKEKNKSSCILISTSSDQFRFTFIFCHKNWCFFFGPQLRLYCFFQNARLMITIGESYFR